MNNRITIRLARLQSLETLRIAKKTLGKFLEGRDMQYTSDVRVNGVVKPEGYSLRANDIVTIVGDVSNG